MYSELFYQFDAHRCIFVAYVVSAVLYGVFKYRLMLTDKGATPLDCTISYNDQDNNLACLWPNIRIF
jgi:hypothetical protein